MGIYLSKQFGINPSIDTCFICGKETSVVLFGTSYKDKNGKNVSWLDRTKIYNYISDRIVVDDTRLVDVTTKDEQNITNLLANINTQLQGKGGNVLTPEYANYLLLEFAKTPYEWKQSNKEIKGFDPAARLYFVDVTYTTTGNYKSVVPDSKIPNGHPDSR